MPAIHLIRFPDREARIRAIRAFREVRVGYVCFPGHVFGITEDHRKALKKTKIPFIYVSKEPSRKSTHATAIQ